MPVPATIDAPPRPEPTVRERILDASYELFSRRGIRDVGIESDGEEIIQLDVSEMESAWRSSLRDKLQAEVLAAAAE